MTLTGTHAIGDPGHTTDHNLLDLALAGKLDAAAAPSLLASHLAVFSSRLNKGQASLTIGVVGDSTGVGNTRWPYLMAVALGVAHPDYTVIVKPWNDSTVAYDADVTVQTGTGTGNGGGPFVITVYNASASGRDSAYSLAHLAAMLPVAPDVTIISHGHNESPTSTVFLPNFDLLVRTIRVTYPKTEVVLTAQNPSGPGASGNTTAQTIATAQQIIEYAATEGYGLIDVMQAWLSYAPTAAAWDAALNVSSDHVHPNDATGSPLWAQLVVQAFTYNRASQPRKSRPLANSLWVPASQFAPANDTLIETAPTYEGSGGSVAVPGGWAFDPASSETVTGWVPLPEHWNTFHAYLYWTTFSAIGGNAGTPIWLLSTATIPDVVNLGGLAPTTMGGNVNLPGGVRGTAVGGADQGKIVAESWLAPAGAYTQRGFHGLRVSRFANNASDTLGIKAVFLGMRYVRVS